MSNRRTIQLIAETANLVPENSQLPQKRGPNRALFSSVSDLAPHQVDAIYKAFHEHGRSIEFISSRSRDGIERR